MRFGRLLALVAWVLLPSGSGRAEGSREFDVNETVWNGATGFLANDQAVNANTVVRVDILNNGAEKVCWRGVGNLRLQRPDGSNIATISGAGGGDCANAISGLTGAYVADILSNQNVGTEWDIRVCASTVTDDNCLNVDANERTGRVWSTAWNFSQNTEFDERYSINGSVYAIVPGGGVGRDAVVEMQMRGVSGAYYTLRANSTGPATTAGARVGRSVPRDASYTVMEEYPLYLNPPESAQYNWTAPQISNVQLTPACGTGVVLNRAAGQISFTSNVVGQYVVVCDVNKDSLYDFAGTTDFSSFGAAEVGVNSISWDGRNNAGNDAPEGSYSCLVRLNVGEFHYIAEDIETAYPGIRMFRVEQNRSRSPIRMFWDDTAVGASESMANGELSPVSPLASGLDPGSSATAAAPFYFAGGNRQNPQGNARAWGDFDGSGAGKGNEAYLDQFSAADTAVSPAFSVGVISSGGDFDGDGLGSARECDIGADPEDSDSDDDGVRDGFEAPNSGPVPNSDADGQPDVLDPDDDGDGVPTSAELGAGENGDGNPADAANSDSVGPRDYLDPDSDDDGVLDGADVARTNPNACRDVDADNCDDCALTGANGSGGNVANDGTDTNANGQCNLTDPDDDADGVLDGSDTNPLVNTACADSDGDACDDCAGGAGPLPAADGVDSDSDGACDVGDADDDNDGVADAGDRAPRDPSLCRDADADSCDDCSVTGAMGGANPAMDGPDADADGRCDSSVTQQDADGDGVEDAQDSAPNDNRQCRDADQDGCDDCTNGEDDPRQDGPDGDGDGRCDAAVDRDGDGVDDAADLDDDGDGILDAQETATGLDPDADGDGLPNQLDLDSDEDGIFDADESGHQASDKNADGKVDGSVGLNGVADEVERGVDSGEVAAPIDTDGDRVPDFLDRDSDADGLEDETEAGDERPSTAPQDSDDDGLPDFRDVDDDGDGLDTADERPGDEDVDSNEDGTPDYLDPEADADEIPTEGGERAPRGTLSGGAQCSAHPDTPPHHALLALGIALYGLFLWRRRSARARRALSSVGLSVLVCMALSETASAQVALEQYKPAPLASDGFGVARPDVLERGTWSTLLWLDYANDPLVYELASGSSRTEEKVVATHLVGHVGAAVGVARRLTLFATLPVHILMEGDKDLTLDTVKPEGDGLGDLALGGRIQLSGLDPDSRFGSALELVARAPTAELFNRQQRYSGDAIGSYEPALIGEARAGRFDIRLRAGARLREKKSIANLELGHELIAGLGMRLRLVQGLYLHAEAYGSTFLSDPFKRTVTPIESLFGIKYHGQALVLGASAGPGLRRGYGSPDVRVVGVVGYAPRKQKKPADTDRDGLLDPDDRCPQAPEDKDGFEDRDGCPDPDNDQDGIQDTQDRCIEDPEDTDDFDDTDGCPDPDNDQDGISDEADVCPLEPEDKDSFEDQDGCVDPDNDKDGLLDAADRCPNEAEDQDGFEDSDGCPEPGGGKVKVTCAKIEISEAVYFDTGKDTIQERSFDLLDQVSNVMKQAKHILKVRIAGHTDSRGNDRQNLELSRRRAASVMHYLVSHGVESERLTSEGYGETEPIASNKSAEGRAQNRRVEFQILEQATECTAP